ncbi:hypothetical protein WKY82_20250 [Gordonia malaquae]|uniref:hypothetical protein n=1 Tax=Gordonia malaquae TaxID=410332 RepID=UPI0030C79D20
MTMEQPGYDTEPDGLSFDDLLPWQQKLMADHFGYGRVEACCHDKFEWFDEAVERCPACGARNPASFWTIYTASVSTVIDSLKLLGIAMGPTASALSAAYEAMVADILANGRPPRDPMFYPRMKYRARRRHAGLTRTGRPR